MNEECNCSLIMTLVIAAVGALAVAFAAGALWAA